MEELIKQHPDGVVKIMGQYYEVESYSMANTQGRRQATLKPVKADKEPK